MSQPTNTAGIATRQAAITRRLSPRRASVSRMASRLGIGVGALGAEGIAAYLRPVVGVILVVADVAVPTLVGIILLVAILRGSQDTCDRVFRLLRWIANRPEPPAPTS
jgi:hypothetical protein